MLQNFHQFNTDLLLIKYLEELTRDENIHGVYLEDDFEPQNYSLPRGGIYSEQTKRRFHKHMLRITPLRF